MAKMCMWLEPKIYSCIIMMMAILCLFVGQAVMLIAMLPEVVTYAVRQVRALPRKTSDALIWVEEIGEEGHAV